MPAKFTYKSWDSCECTYCLAGEAHPKHEDELAVCVPIDVRDLRRLAYLCSVCEHVVVRIS